MTKLLSTEIILKIPFFPQKALFQTNSERPLRGAKKTANKLVSLKWP